MSRQAIIRSFLRRNLVLTVFCVLTGLICNLITVLIPISIGRFYEFLFGLSSFRLKLLNDLPFINSNDFKTFLWFFFALIAAKFLIEYANRFGIGVLGEKFTRDLREELFSKQLKIKYSTYEETGIGKYLLRHSGDLKSIQSYLTMGVFRFFQDFILIVLLVVAIAIFDYRISIIIGSFIVVSYLLLFLLNNWLYKYSVQRRNKRSGMLSFVSSTLNSILSIKALNKIVPMKKRYGKRSQQLYDIGINYNKTVALIHAMIPFITYGMIAVIMIDLFIYRLNSAASSTIEASTLLILILLIISFLPIFRRLLRVNIVWKLGAISFEKLNNIFQLESEREEIPKELENNGSFHFDRVEVLSDNGNRLRFSGNINEAYLNFIKEDSSRVIGKEFIKMMNGFKPIVSGDITFGSLNFKELSEKAKRKLICTISEEIPLEGRTVIEAICYSRKAEKREKAIELLNELQSGISSSLRLKADDKIGHNSSLLNPVQVKILLWCRAILTGKKIMIIHRGFEHFEAELKESFTNILNHQLKKHTIIWIDETLPSYVNSISNLEVTQIS